MLQRRRLGATDPLVRNLLLSCLPLEVYERIQGHLIPVNLLRKQVLHQPGEEIYDLYFPTSCLISVNIKMQDGRTVEAGLSEAKKSLE